MNKEALRNEMKQKRRQLSADTVYLNSRMIREKLYALQEYQNAAVVMVYMAAFNEPRTADIIAHVLDSGKRAVVPVTHMDTGMLELSYIENMDCLVKGAYGILEPASVITAPYDALDLILVPGIAFDRAGNRIGFGKGYYDKLLSVTAAVKIGLCYSFQIADEIVYDRHDIPMDILITEREVRYCDKR